MTDERINFLKKMEAGALYKTAELHDCEGGGFIKVISTHVDWSFSDGAAFCKGQRIGSDEVETFHEAVVKSWCL